MLNTTLRELYSGVPCPAGRFKNTVGETEAGWLSEKGRRFATAVAVFAKTRDAFPRRSAAAKRVAKLRAYLGL